MTPYSKIIRDYEGKTEYPVILVTENGKLRELHKKLQHDCTLGFITAKDSAGRKTYRRSAIFILLKAIFDVAGKENVDHVVIHYSIGNALYFTMKGSATLDQELLDRVKVRMRELVDRKLPICKRSVSTDDAVSMFHRHHMYDKEKLFRYRRVSRVNIYSLENFEDYFYGFMVPSTGYLRYYDVIPYADGFMLQFPDKNTREVAPFVPAEKLFHTLKTSRDWGKMLEIDTIGALNDAIAAGKQGAISIHRFVQPHSSLTIGRNRNDFIELDKNDIKVENYDNSSRQIPGHNASIDTKHSFRDAKLVFTEEQVKAETARCLGCGASVVDQNKCIGCGICTTKCEFDAIKLHRDLPGCSKMVPSEDKLKYILPNGAKQAIKIKFSKKK